MAPPSAAQHWYPSIAAVEREATCAEMERLARGQAPSKAWGADLAVTTGAKKAAASSGRSSEGVERLLEAAKHLDGMDRLSALVQLLRYTLSAVSTCSGITHAFHHALTCSCHC